MRTILLIVVLAPICGAQTTIFNVPEPDAKSAGQWYLEFDSLSHFDDSNNRDFQTVAPRAVYGLAKDVEVGMNFDYYRSSAPSSSEIQPNAKWVFFDDDKQHLTVNIGAIVIVSVNHRIGGNAFGFLYSEASKKFSGAYGLRITGGAYHLVSRTADTGSKTGALVGYEQPVKGKLSFVADWLSGTNKGGLPPQRFGYFTPGISITTSSTTYINIGYSIGNEGAGNNSLYVYVGMTLSKCK